MQQTVPLWFVADRTVLGLADSSHIISSQSPEPVASLTAGCVGVLVIDFLPSRVTSPYHQEAEEWGSY